MKLISREEPPKLKTELAELKEAQRWRKVEEELPKELVDVLAVSKSKEPFVAWVTEGTWQSEDWEALLNEVTHWRPLPKFEEEE